jgi:hypothetical protein
MLGVVGRRPGLRCLPRAGLLPQDRVLMPGHQQFSILRQATAEHRDGHVEHPAGKRVDDLEKHPAIQTPPMSSLLAKVQVSHSIEVFDRH